MEGHGVDGPVTLIIRAPNQKYHDQTISCFLDWTVEELKKHISNVYPSRPFPREQRLVYSGRLLQDHQHLRDVLREQDEYHMVHLVCAPRSPASDPSNPSEPPVNSQPGFMNTDAAGSAPSATASNQDVPNSSGAGGSSEALRRRGGATPAHVAAPWAAGASFPAPVAPPAGFPAHSVYTPVQMLWWQRMYAQHYYMQYRAAAMAASQTPPPAASPRPPDAPVRAPAPDPAPDDRPPERIPRMNAQGGAVQNEDEPNRDWLDWLYTVSRVAVLLSIVYFYSSFSRFVMVIVAVLLVYLHQAGWFPFRPELQNPAAPAEEPAAENQMNNDMQDMERIMDDGMEDEEGESADEGSEEAAPLQPSFLSSTWSFISTFFTSLVPEGPPRAAR
ncbi:homocysteine-responsive endoplasmic reticulum-resident ubiquitin-like domain member 2 protein [Trichomycterus rosablanca]|uniref:homocysteine-responsive endoplasmic reticulum-resident ubiquitin-like domain member 2 protein n=1 Tax=Trichomycterus rosablanca TaxID=2290929 RepID=UPI002F34F9BB